MDELRSFFNNTGPPARQVTKLRGPATGGLCISEEDPTIFLNRKYEHRTTILQTGTNYITPVIARETEMYLKSEAERQSLACQDSMAGGLESLDQLSAFGTSVPNIEELTEDAMKEVYNKYSFQMKEESSNLAISEYKQQILGHIHAYPIVIIEGPTGCGKTTQVPQWILDDSYLNRKPCRIIVTQPRRIAAISIAKRVAQERGWDVGGIVGYQVALENKTSADTRISYVTTGVLLQKLVSAKTMNEYTHVILDEVHERGQEMDFLLIVVKRLLFTISPKVKVILMSATFNTTSFLDFFKIPTPLGLTNSVCVEVAKQARMFTVKTFYLNQLQKLTRSYQLTDRKEASIEPEMYEFVVKLVFAFEDIDKHEEDFEDYSEAEFPSVLIFLPGINEIEEMYSQLTDLTLRAKIDAACAKYKWWVLPLHSTITADEQVRVFQRAPPGHRKIILATNIAESSITVPDIKYVVDFCLMKHVVADSQTNFTSLQLTWASKANCEQRAGRAGRVRDGRVYRLVTDKFYDTLPNECTPEILRCPLERLVLLSKTLDMGPPSDILALAMNPPELSNIHRTVLVMKELGGLTKFIKDEWCPTDGDLTYMGRIMAKLPLDVRLSKLIVLGHLFGCLEECIIMAASMSVKSIFSNPFRERLHAYNSKLTWADGCTSDCITLLNVYKVWNHLRKSQAFKQKGTNEAQWARRFYVQVRSLHELDEMVRELRVRLSREGIESVKGNSPWPRNELNLALKVIIAGAFYPQYFVQVSQDEAREREAVKTLSGLDPRNTVYLKNFPDGQPGAVYASAIKNAIRQKIGDEPRVTFDKNSQRVTYSGVYSKVVNEALSLAPTVITSVIMCSGNILWRASPFLRKVYLTFDDSARHAKRDRESGDPSIPGQVVLPVYKAVKARQLKIDIRIPILPLQRANELALTLDTDHMSLDIQTIVPRLPEIDDTHFPIRICHLSSVGRFWAQYADASAASELRSVAAALRQPLLGATAPRAGDVVAAPRADGSLARARVLSNTPHGQLEVLFIDFGVHGRVKQSNVRELPLGVCKLTPPLALPCALAGVGPSPLLDAHAHWTQRAFDEFKKLVSSPGLIAKIYSVVHGVVSVELLGDNGRQNVNQELIRLGYAVPCEESYESKMNHDIRLNAPELSLAQRRAHSREQMEQAYYQLKEVDIPDYYKECFSDVCLLGPHSPLETTVHSLMYASRENQVTIEWNSVNSVLLDTNPQEIYERLVVAADISQNEHSSKLSIRHTTFMPNIAGLPAIMALLFSPTAELRRDAAGTRYVSALCGLGSDEHGAPYFPEHDILVSIDCRLPVDDMGYINHIRHLMDYMMHESNDDIQKQVPKCIRDDLLQLLMKRRKHCEPETVNNAWEWKSVPEQEFLEISVPDMASQAVVYPLIVPLELYPMSHDQLLALKRDNDQLKLLVGRTPISSVSELVCKLCNTGPLNAQAMRLHLFSNAHLEKEEDFRIFQS